MDDFSEQCARELLSAFPEWRARMRTAPADDGSTYLVVEVDPPARATVRRGLLIHTDDEEVTVGFDH